MPRVVFTENLRRHAEPPGPEARHARAGVLRELKFDEFQVAREFPGIGIAALRVRDRLVEPPDHHANFAAVEFVWLVDFQKRARRGKAAHVAGEL